MTERELEAVADRAADKAIRNLFLQIGVDITEPIEVQKDFHHLRKWRKSNEAITLKVLLTAIGTIVMGTLAAIWVGLRTPN